MDASSILIEDHFRARMIGTFGGAGKIWLTEVKSILGECAQRWGLEVGASYPNPSYQLVFRATGTDGKRYALKLGVPRDELRDEATALRFWGGNGAVRLVADDPMRGALLLELVDPGTQLADLATIDDDRATEIGAMVFGHVAEAGALDPVTASASRPALPPLSRWGDGFDRYLQRNEDRGPIDSATVLSASHMYSQLHNSTTTRVVLHGDLHHHNILRSGSNDNDWLAIDPKGVTGDPAFEAGAFLRNPGTAFGPTVDGAARTHRRIDILTACSGLDRERVVDWAWAGTVLSAVWCVEDDGPSSTSHEWPLQVARWIADAK